VQEETGGKQTPWVSSTLTSSFYFHPVSKPDAEAEFTLTAKRMEDARRYEQAEDWDQAIELLQQIVAKKPGASLEAAADRRIPYLTARRDARAKFEANDFAAAALLYAQALALDPFAIDAAFDGAKSYLIADRLPDAVKLLQAVRVRGTTEAIRKTDLMLKELSSVSQDAAQQLTAGIPQPPAVEEVFGGLRFGAPDWDAGGRYLLPSSINIQTLIKDLPEPPVPAVSSTTSPAASAQPAATAGENPASHLFHVEIVSNSSSRDLVIRKVGAGALNSSGVQVPSGVRVKVITDPPGAELTVEGGDAEQRCKSPCMLSLATQKHAIKAQIPGYRPQTRVITPAAEGTELEIVMQPQLGYVQFEGLQTGTPVVLDGKPLNYRETGRVSLVAGTYEIKFVREGQVVSRQNVEVRDQANIALTVRQ
jgi:hypothetical protein